jgi:VanZ family protein
MEAIFTFFEKNPKTSLSITFIGAAGIFIISSLTFYPGKAVSILTILYHILAFFFLALFLFISLIQGRKNYLLIMPAFLLALSYAISDEIHQFFVPGRSCTICDVFLDLTGISLAFLVYLIRLNLPQKNIKTQHNL